MFNRYIANGFEPWLVENNIKKPVILFIDGHKSHLNPEISQFCSDNGIILYGLLPNCTHLLQPTDVSVFKPLKSQWKVTLRNWQMANIGKPLTKIDFCPLLEDVLIKKTAGNLSTTIKNGFRKCGLFPFDPDAVDYSKCVQNQMENLQSSNIQSTINQNK